MGAQADSNCAGEDLGIRRQIVRLIHSLQPADGEGDRSGTVYLRRRRWLDAGKLSRRIGKTRV